MWPGLIRHLGVLPRSGRRWIYALLFPAQGHKRGRATDIRIQQIERMTPALSRNIRKGALSCTGKDIQTLLSSDGWQRLQARGNQLFHLIEVWTCRWVQTFLAKYGDRITLATIHP
jgi:hypothetical protein